MAANEGWYSTWFANGWFPSVWFAPGDESGVPEEELRQEYRGSGRGHRPAESAADLERIVREKWEAIERADLRDSLVDKPADLPADDEREALIGNDSTEAIAAEFAPDQETSAVALQPPAIQRQAENIPAILSGDITAAAMLERERREARRKEEEALLLLLAEAL